MLQSHKLWLRSTVRVWSAGQCIMTLEHGSPVQCLLVLEQGELLSGCSDGTIRLWKAGAIVHTFEGHTDTVRSASRLAPPCLAELP